MDKPIRIARHQDTKQNCLTTVQGSEVLGSKVTPVGNCLLTIVIKIRDTRLHPLGETAF
jgi:hypothetical protein